MINILESVLIFTILATIVWAKSIDNLQVLGDFRSIKLKWNYYDRHSNHDAGGPRFKIRYRVVVVVVVVVGKKFFPIKFSFFSPFHSDRYCELNNWQMKSRCKDRIVKATNMTTGNDDKHNDQHHDDPATNDDVIIDLKRTNNEHYEASINSLRVHTNYSVLVQVINDRFGHQNTNDDHDDGDDGDLIKTKRDAILVSTKSCKRQNAKDQSDCFHFILIQIPSYGPYFTMFGQHLRDSSIHWTILWWPYLSRRNR